MRLAKRMDGMNGSVVRQMLKLMAKPGIISFAGGMPSPDVFPVEALRRAMNRVMTEEGTVALQYGTTEGYLPLREKIAARHKAEGFHCTADDIMIISGSQQGLDLAGKVFLDPGDVVLCEDPTYTAALSSMRGYECEFVPVATDEAGMVMEDLERKLKENKNVKLIYVIPTFQNPSGKTWTLERRKGLLSLAEKYDVPILEDNPYGELRFEGDVVPALKSMDQKGLVVYLGTFSKILSPGIRIGWIAAEKELLSKFNLAKQGADLQASTIMQMVVNVYLEENDLNEELKKLRDVYRKRRDLMICIMEQEFPEGTKWQKPMGGLFIWVELPENMDTAAILSKAVEKNVAFIPGVSFFAFQNKKNTLRLNFSNSNEGQIERGMKLLGEVLRAEK